MMKIKNKRIEIFLRGVLNIFKILGFISLGFVGATGIMWLLNFLMTVSVWLTIAVIAGLCAAAYVIYYYCSTAEILKELEKEKEICLEEVKRCEEELETHKWKWMNDEDPQLYNEHTIHAWECHLKSATIRLNEVNHRIKNL